MNVGYFSSSLWPENGLLVHGGVKVPLGQNPSNLLQLVSTSSKFKKAVILNDKGPNLSHHASCLVTIDKDPILILVGGWTGNSRTSKVYAFNLGKKSWIDLKENPSGHHRVDPPVGLSGHSATMINSKLICVIGREGGIKTQRKFGQMFLLHLDVKNHCYWYTESPILPESRSGHTASLAPPVNGTCDFMVFGGRDIDRMFISGKWKLEMLDKVPVSYEKALDHLTRFPRSKTLTRMIGLRYHAMVILSPYYILVHGGRHFKAMSSKDVNGHFFLGHLGKNGETWVQLETKIIPRFGHEIVLGKDGIYVVGGFSNDADKKAAETEKLSFLELKDDNGGPGDCGQPRQ